MARKSVINAFKIVQHYLLIEFCTSFSFKYDIKCWVKKDTFWTGIDFTFYFNTLNSINYQCSLTLVTVCAPTDRQAQCNYIDQHEW